MTSAVVRALRRLRLREWLNRPLTATLRSAYSRTRSDVPEFVVRHLPRVGPVSVALPDGTELKLMSSGEDWIPSQLYWRRLAAFEPDAAVFYYLARSSRITIDVGAHVGLYSLMAALANPAGRVLALEPLPAVYAGLIVNVEANSARNVTCLAAAAGSHDDRRDLYYVPTEGRPTSSGLNRDFLAGRYDDLRSISVETVRLDSLLPPADRQRVDLVKIDTESTEPEVLAGMAAILEQSRPDLICEVLRTTTTEAAIEAAVRGLGYRFYHLTPSGALRHERLTGHRGWRNYLLTARDPAKALDCVDRAMRFLPAGEGS